jgi:hypothetical protein
MVDGAKNSPRPSVHSKILAKLPEHLNSYLKVYNRAIQRKGISLKNFGVIQSLQEATNLNGDVNILESATLPLGNLKTTTGSLPVLVSRTANVIQSQLVVLDPPPKRKRKNRTCKHCKSDECPGILKSNHNLYLARFGNTKVKCHLLSRTDVPLDCEVSRKPRNIEVSRQILPRPSLEFSTMSNCDTSPTEMNSEMHEFFRSLYGIDQNPLWNEEAQMHMKYIEEFMSMYGEFSMGKQWLEKLRRARKHAK